MNARVFVIIIVSMMLFTASFESGVAAAVQLPEDSLPSQRVYRFDKEKRDLDEALCACPDLDPCEIGNYQMEVYDLIRKCFKSCPWRPFNARCTMPPKDEREKQEQIDYNRLRYTFAKIPCYLDAVRFNKTDYERELWVLRAFGCRVYYGPKSPDGKVVDIMKL